MIHALVITVLVLLILAAERLTITKMVSNEGGRKWIRSHSFMHPNAISIIRIPMGLICMFVWRYAQAHDNILLMEITLLWFAFWMITDITDGTIARGCELVTESGKWLDPLSDKCMYFPIVFMFSQWGDIPKGWMIALLTIDALGQSSRLFSKKKAANYFGKAKTALITTLLSVIALNVIVVGVSADGQGIPFITPKLIYLSTISCTILAFLSVYCKLIPDVWYANSMTLANFLCGCAAILCALKGERPMLIFILIFAAQFFDLFDGRLARKFGSTRFGALFDDIADGTSFGGAITFLIITQLMEELPSLSLIVAFIYFCAVIYRLYRFSNPSIKLPKGIFQGLPSPAGAMLGGSSVLLLADNYAVAAAAMVVITSILMISNIRYLHFGVHIWPGLPGGMKLVCLILLLMFLNMSIGSQQQHALAFKWFCLSMALLYVFYGLENPFWRRNKG